MNHPRDHRKANISIGSIEKREREKEKRGINSSVVNRVKAVISPMFHSSGYAFVNRYFFVGNKKREKRERSESKSSHMIGVKFEERMINDFFINILITTIVYSEI